MKKHLLPLLGLCLVLLSGCLGESTFFANNYTDYVTCRQGKLVGDLNGYTFTVTEDLSETSAWREEGGRFLIRCDILDRTLAIRLRKVLPVTVTQPLPLPEAIPDYDDPVEILDSRISGGYLNLYMQYYKDPASNYAHRFLPYFSKGENGVLHLYLFHDGNRENPAYVEASKLVTAEWVYSFPVEELLPGGVHSGITVHRFKLKTGEDGKISVIQEP